MCGDLRASSSIRFTIKMRMRNPGMHPGCPLTTTSPLQSEPTGPKGLAKHTRCPPDDHRSPPTSTTNFGIFARLSVGNTGTRHGSVSAGEPWRVPYFVSWHCHIITMTRDMAAAVALAWDCHGPHGSATTVPCQAAMPCAAIKAHGSVMAMIKQCT